MFQKVYFVKHINKQLYKNILPVREVQEQQL